MYCTIDLYEVLASTVRSGGVSTLWRGLGATLLRDVPFSGESAMSTHPTPLPCC